jgi:hypothetical protein
VRLDPRSNKPITPKACTGKVTALFTTAFTDRAAESRVFVDAYGGAPKRALQAICDWRRVHIERIDALENVSHASLKR